MEIPKSEVKHVPSVFPLLPRPGGAAELRVRGGGLLRQGVPEAGLAAPQAELSAVRLP